MICVIYWVICCISSCSKTVSVPPPKGDKKQRKSQLNIKKPSNTNKAKKKTTKRNK